MTQLDPLLPEAQVDPDSRPAVDWSTDPWDATDQTGSVERLRGDRRYVKWIVWASMAVAIVAILIAGFVGWWYLGKINPEGAAGDVQSFTVNEQDDLESVAQRLADDGLITDPGIFEWYVEREGGLELTPGYYEIRPNDHMGNVLGRLRTPPGQTYSKVTFPEGFTLAKMATRLDTSVDRLTADEFLTAATDGSIRSAWQPLTVNSLEGLLFPDTYQVSNAESEGQVIERMIALMERVGDQEDIVNKSAALGRTEYETLIIASMIEREARVPEDRAKISPRDPQSAVPVGGQSRQPVPVADRRHRAVRARSGRARSGDAVLAAAHHRHSLQHLFASRAPADADRVAGSGFDSGGAQPGAQSTRRRSDLR